MERPDRAFRPLILWGLLGGFYEGFCNSGYLLVGVVEDGGHLLKLSLWWERFEAGLLEPLGQVSDHRFGILAAADLLANIPSEDESNAGRGGPGSSDSFF
jgi:hypothetical protein